MDAKVKDVSETAFWVAQYRVNESKRKDALFQDVYAELLAGEKGRSLFHNIPHSKSQTWVFTTRTVLFDEYILECIDKYKISSVINFACGLDTRPYRLPLQKDFSWVEVDFPNIIDYKNEVLRDKQSNCKVERIACDLSKQEERETLYAELAKSQKNALILSEGLLLYLNRSEVSKLAEELSVQPYIQFYATDLISHGLKKKMLKNQGGNIEFEGNIIKFAPKEGPMFFENFGWKTVKISSMLQKAVQIKRGTFIHKILALFPDSKGAKFNIPWVGVCLYTKK